MSALGAVSLTIPGPKMIWHFGALGMENSIFTCENGVVNEPGGTDGDCKLATKPQPQWVENWLGNPNRNQIYNDWARLNQLKIDEDVFEGNYSIESGNLTPKIYIWDDAIPASSLKNVVILANFDVTAQNVVPNFPYPGNWFDLMDETGSTTLNVTNTAATINIPAGQFRIFGNQAATLSIDNPNLASDFRIYPNPTHHSFKINKDVSELNIFDITGKLVKTFKGSFTQNSSFDISELTQSIYLIKIENNDGQTLTSKLIKL
jgi:hypothetical protein